MLQCKLGPEWSTEEWQDHSDPGVYFFIGNCIPFNLLLPFFFFFFWTPLKPFLSNSSETEMLDSFFFFYSNSGEVLALSSCWEKSAGA